METAQDLFDQSVRHMAKQKRRSTDGKLTHAKATIQCMYRSPSGAMCAVGCLFQPDEYRECMEGKSVGSMWVDGLLPTRFDPHVSLLSRLQRAHDAITSVDMLTSELTRIAHYFYLECSSVHEIKEWQ